MKLRAFTKWGHFLIKGEVFFNEGRGWVKCWPRKLSLVKVRCFINGSMKWKKLLQNLIESPNYH